MSFIQRRKDPPVDVIQNVGISYDVDMSQSPFPEDYYSALVQNYPREFDESQGLGFLASMDIYSKQVFILILCDDGHYYHHFGILLGNLSLFRVEVLASFKIDIFRLVK